MCVYIIGHIYKKCSYMFLLVLPGLFPLIIVIVNNACIIIVRVHLKMLYKTRSLGNRNELWNSQQSLKILKAMYKKYLALLGVFGTIHIVNLITWLPLIQLSFDNTATTDTTVI